MLGWHVMHPMQPSVGSALQECSVRQPGMARRYSDQPDLRRNSRPDTASITIGGKA